MEQSLLVRMVGQTLQKRKDNAVQIVGAMKRIVRLLHLVSVDHLLDHLTAYRADLTSCKIAVVALLEVYANFVSCFHLELVECFSAFLSCDTFHFRISFSFVFRACNNIICLHDLIIRGNL